MVDEILATGVSADGSELILKSPDGTRWRLSVDDEGTLSVTEIVEE